MCRVSGTIPLGNQDLEGLAYHLIDRIAEDRLSPFIEEDDLLSGIDADDCVRRNRHDARENGVRDCVLQLL